jgi:hypothetical protein
MGDLMEIGPKSIEGLLSSMKPNADFAGSFAIIEI